MKKIRYWVNKLKIFIKTGFTLEKIFQRRKLRIIFLCWIVLTVLLSGWAIWRVATTPSIKIYHQVSLLEILRLVKQEEIEYAYLKYFPEDPKLTILAELKTGEIISSPILDFTRLNYTELIEALKNNQIESVIVFNSPEERRVFGLSKEETISVGSLPFSLSNLDDFFILLTEYKIQPWELKTQVISDNNFEAKWIVTILASVNFVLLLAILAVINYDIREKELQGLAAKGKITFADVAGIEEAKSEIMEILDFIKFKEKYVKHGAKMPKGALLVGPPGCGKTLMAKALANEAEVPFESIAGSEFVERYVGVGASRVRDLFKGAKRTARTTNKVVILFIDEIDALGTRKMESAGDAEYTQTIAQVLHEMDGFELNEKVFVLGATNCPENLDPAIRRPGRFDRQIIVQIPDLKGRKAILSVHCKNKRLHPSVDLQKIAEITPLGFSGADLANVANEAAIRAARLNKEAIEMEDLEKSIEKVLVGSERKSAVMSDEDKWLTAWHEAGHAIAAKFSACASPPEKISIIPTTKGVGGYTRTSQTEEKYYWRKEELLGRIKLLFGGRIAEELIFGAGNISTGAREDFKQANQIAEEMVCDFGMATDILGPRTFGKTEGNSYLGRTIRRQDYSEETAKAVDRTKKTLLTKCYKDAENILKQHLAELRLLAEELKEKETLNIQEINQLLNQ